MPQKYPQSRTLPPDFAGRNRTLNLPILQKLLIFWTFPDIPEQRDGAVERNNLEPSELTTLLDQLEEWGSVLNSEPAVIHRLAAFAAAAGNGVPDEEVSAPDGGEQAPQTVPPVWEPSP